MTYSTSENITLDTIIESKTDEDSSAKNVYQKKIDTMIQNYEKEKEVKNQEINELNSRLNNILQIIEKKLVSMEEYDENKTGIMKTIEELSNKNENILGEIEEKIETFEQIQKLNKSEIKEEDIYNEVNTLEKKYDEMITNWDEYANQAKARIDELKNNVETKKKEYNFKFEKINLLKKEVDEISSKIVLKQELANFLNDEYQKIPVDINRNKFISKISDLTQNIVTEKHNIINYIQELKNAEGHIGGINDTIKRVDNELEDKLFQDAKSNSALKDLYSLFIKIREGYNVIQKNIIDTQIVKNKVKEIENKVEDYQIKLKSYDINQLKEQVDMLKIENQKYNK